jgi:hypothetical protein
MTHLPVCRWSPSELVRCKCPDKVRTCLPVAMTMQRYQQAICSNGTDIASYTYASISAPPEGEDLQETTQLRLSGHRLTSPPTSWKVLDLANIRFASPRPAPDYPRSNVFRHHSGWIAAPRTPAPTRYCQYQRCRRLLTDMINLSVYQRNCFQSGHPVATTQVTPFVTLPGSLPY